ncbi:MAG: acylphosphatase [Planctomycetaceae bacterium]|nr:acylphosphatase [Planctomycetaceae bacterium]
MRSIPSMCEPELNSLAREVSYFGHVQGVGFRWTTSRIARRHDVVGNVRNEPDGTVTLRVQGPSAVVQAFLDEIASTMSGYITRVETKGIAFQDDLAGFRIIR